MAKKFWTIALDDRTATVTLEHSFWNCRHRLSVDDRLIFDKRILLEFGTEHEFTVEGHACVLHVDVPGRLTYEYSLTMDGREIEPQHNPFEPSFLFAQKSAVRNNSAYPPTL